MSDIFKLIRADIERRRTKKNTEEPEKQEKPNFSTKENRKNLDFFLIGDDERKFQDSQFEKKKKSIDIDNLEGLDVLDALDDFDEEIGSDFEKKDYISDIEQVDYVKLDKMPKDKQLKILKKEYLVLLDRIKEISADFTKVDKSFKEQSVEYHNMKKTLSQLKDFVYLLGTYMPDGSNLKDTLENPTWNVSDIEDEFISRLNFVISRAKNADVYVEQETADLTNQIQGLKTKITKVENRNIELEQEVEHLQEQLENAVFTTEEKTYIDEDYTYNDEDENYDEEYEYEDENEEETYTDEYEEEEVYEEEENEEEFTDVYDQEYGDYFPEDEEEEELPPPKPIVQKRPEKQPSKPKHSTKPQEKSKPENNRSSRPTNEDNRQNRNQNRNQNQQSEKQERQNRNQQSSRPPRKEETQQSRPPKRENQRPEQNNRPEKQEQNRKPQTKQERPQNQKPTGTQKPERKNPSQNQKSEKKERPERQKPTQQNTRPERQERPQQKKPPVKPKPIEEEIVPTGPELDDTFDASMMDDVDPYIDNLSEETKYIIKIVGETGVSRDAELKDVLEKREDAKPLFFSGGKFQKNNMKSAVSDLMGAQIFTKQELNLAIKGAPPKAFELTKLGKDIYFNLTNEIPVKSEIALLIRQHASAEHGFLIKDSSNIFREMGYTVYTERKDLRHDLAGGKRKDFDIIIEKDGKKCFIEVERGTHGEADFFKAMDKIRQITDEFYFICPNEEVLFNKTKRHFFLWIQKHLGGMDQARGLKANFTTFGKLKEGKKPLWDDIQL